MVNTDLEKQHAARASLAYIKEGMVVGIGSGSTSEHMVNFLGESVQQGLGITGVPSSKKIESLARSLSIPLTTLAEVQELDVYIDGADEVDTDFNMIKGGGGALLREKILAYNAKKRVIIVDSSKQVKKLGKFKLPIEVIPFAQHSVMRHLNEMNLKPLLREREIGAYTTDEGNHIIDADISTFHDYKALNEALLRIPGVVETGLFLGFVDLLIVGTKNETKIYGNCSKMD